MKDIRSDSDQASRNRQLCEEQLTDYAISAAAHLVELGRFHLKLDQQQKALEPFKYALALWKTHGGHWPDRQAQAISELEDKISRILKDEPVDPQLRAEWWRPQGALPVKEEGAAVLREQSEEASVKSLFDAYLMIDWSASSTPKQGRDSVWYCLVRREAGRVRMEVLRNPSTRCEAAEEIRKLLVELSSNNLATLVGFDFTYGYPAGLASKLGLVGVPWLSIWQELQRQIEDAPDNCNNRFEVAARWNKRLTGGAAPFWGCPASKADKYLSRRKLDTDWARLELAELRVCEQKAGAQPTWKLMYPGSVGSQTLLGIPHLANLRFDSALESQSCVWPFETGLGCDKNARIVHAEIYPSLIPIEQEPGEVNDAAQVKTLANYFAQMDQTGQLERLFAGPPGLSAEQQARICQEEGWILGVV